jgi:uronate dehydrogenase
MNRVLITGAAGNIGRTLREGLRARYPLLRLTDIRSMDAAGPGEEVVEADLCDAEAMLAVMQGVDSVVHLGGTPEESDWESVHANNIVGLFNVYEAARQAGVHRIVFASSNHVVGFYRRDHRVGDQEPARPDSRYGVSKVFGEAIARLYADKHGIAAICLRIGSFRVRPTDIRMLSTWISPADMVRLARCSLEAPDVHFEIVYGVSANPRNWWDNPGAERIGYRPKDNAEQYADEMMATMSPEDEPIEERLFHGGPFCGMEFNARIDDID